MGQHTPGPWTVDRLHGEAGKPYVVMGVNGDGDNAVSVLTGQRDGDTWDAETVANSALIAAAPAMLEALRETMAALTDITNAAENGEAYTFEELAKVTFQKPINDAFLAIAAAERPG